MLGKPKNILLTGVPGVGKTTLVRWMVERLRQFHPAGFYTEEIRERGRRQGFLLVSLRGGTGVLSHVACESPLRVGRYGVDSAAFEEFLDLSFPANLSAGILIIDEIGKMECHSRKFRCLVTEVLDSNETVIATVAKRGDEFIEGIKKREDSILYELTLSNRDRMGELILRELRNE